MQEPVKNELGKFGETMIVRGVPRVFKCCDKVLRVVWIVALIASLSLTMWQLDKVFVKYLSFGAKTSVKEVFNDIVFPQMTVCNLQSPLGAFEDQNFTWKECYNLTKSLYNRSPSISNFALFLPFGNSSKNKLSTYSMIT